MLTRAVDAILPMAPVLDCVAEFDALGHKTAPGARVVHPALVADRFI